ncbi:hypothetical protein Barb4_00954 [Bacteroidales bacterium Barb4]|nr:hypothetical protein Barb4_00954 [Bacteroidales bacterium Barb4]
MLPNKIKLQLHIVHIGGNRYNSILLQTYGNFNKGNKHMRISSGHSFRKPYFCCVAWGLKSAALMGLPRNYGLYRILAIEIISANTPAAVTSAPAP